MATKVFEKSKMLTETPFHYCPGCTHGIVHRLIAESLEELELQDRAIGIAPVGCAVFLYRYFNCDMQEAAHGRAPALATGIKRVLPDSIVFSYQGDGDLAAIGCGEINNAAMRGEKITVIFINNAIYGMTGGQMAPTTLIGQRSTTSVLGRDPNVNGYPIKVCEMLSAHRGAHYIERVSVDSPGQVRKAKKAIKKAFDYQNQDKGLNFVEVLSTCPTNWGMTAVESLEFVRTRMIEEFPLGVFVDKGAE